MIKKLKKYVDRIVDATKELWAPIPVAKPIPLRPGVRR